ncbi:MAG: 30S ribosomal protein S4 [Clostridia bacterium]|nr:30S ribosomal protein S4 [Clostridia bacterium]MCR5693413.1 30S ribosomal protein S4 [Clostridia bacterium]
MARYTDASCRLCRREGCKLFLKGEKCFSAHCPFEKRNQAPGQHGAAQVRKKSSEYGVQIREKQKVKRYYGVLEKQFRNYFELASKKKGVTGENLLVLLESRLDNVVYRIGLGQSRAEARQLVRHGHFTVNGKKVDIPSFRVAEGDVIAIAQNSREIKCLEDIVSTTSGRLVPSWLDYDRDNYSAKVVSAPKREDIDFDIKEHLIVELYSK